MFLDTQRSWTVYLQSEKKSKESACERPPRKVQLPHPNPTPAEVRASFLVASQGQGTYGAGLA